MPTAILIRVKLSNDPQNIEDWELWRVTYSEFIWLNTTPLLKIRAMAQYGGGMGGGFVDKKKFRQTPLLIFGFNVMSSFLKKNIV